MGFKVDSSFLKFLTMGALGVRHVIDELRVRGFEPIELERYCTSNKIWATKIKRLRLPDILCVRTGMRVEARAKSDLKIRVSDALANPERRWDAGHRAEDLIALVACKNGASGPTPAGAGVYFTVRALRKSVDQSKLGPPKSASEGAERDRTWPAVVPSRPGKVLAVDSDRLAVLMEGDGEPPRKQTYSLKGKHAYVVAGDRFPATVTMLAGAPRRVADLNSYLGNVYEPLVELFSGAAIDRYAAAKAVRFRADLHAKAIPKLEKLLKSEKEIRVALEVAGSAAALKLAAGEARIAEILWNDALAEMSMEAIFILTELKTPFAREQLLSLASDGRYSDDERRQAAIWGLGKVGLKAYADLVPFIADAEENAAFHAIAAFGPDTPKKVIETLVSILVSGDPRKSPAASEVLRMINNSLVLQCLVNAVTAKAGSIDWALATIGRLSANMVRKHLGGTPLLRQMEPMLLLAPGASWLANEDTLSNMAFLTKQEL